MKYTDLKKKIAALFTNAGCDVTPGQLDTFCRFYQLFERYNDEFDLSRIKKIDDIIIKHFIDSIYITKLYTLPDSIVDIGTGAGFPGLPLKILFPEKYIILAEPRHKRVEFMRMVIKELQLKNVDVYPHKVTEESSFNVRGVITRAFEEINSTLDRVKNFLPKDGEILFLKGPGVTTDFSSITVQNQKDYTCLDDISYRLPGTSHKRRLVVYKKVTEREKFIYKLLPEGKTSLGFAIQSSENKRFKDYKSILSAQGIKKSGLAIVSGKKIISEVREHFPDFCKFLLVQDGYREHDDAFNNLLHTFARNNSLFLLKKSLFNELDILHTRAPLLVCEFPPLKDWRGVNFDGCTLLVPFQDPVNVGSVVRSAVAFGIRNIVLLQEAAHPFHPKSIRASGGAVFRVSLYNGPSIRQLDLLNEGSNTNVPVITLDADGTPLPGYEFPETFFLLPGLEGQGVPDDLRANAVAVPIHPEVESLNAAIATSIVLFSYKQGSAYSG